MSEEVVEAGNIYNAKILVVAFRPSKSIPS